MTAQLANKDFHDRLSLDSVVTRAESSVDPHLLSKGEESGTAPKDRAAITYSLVETPLRHWRITASLAVLMGIGMVAVAISVLSVLVAVT